VLLFFCDVYNLTPSIVPPKYKNCIELLSSL
ncbi:Variable lymphocyte receptor A cassette, partial [Caenorhabditis elegans]